MNQEKVGKYIANCRKKKKITQEQLAEKLNITSKSVSRWETGKTFPDISLLKSLCKELDISIEEIINGEDSSSEEAKTKAIINTIKDKEKTKRKLYIVSIIFIIVVITLMILSTFIYNSKETELNDYYERNYEKSILGRNVEAFIKYRYNGEYPDYYGGMYISDDSYNLIVQIVKDKIPSKKTLEYSYYYELLTFDKSIKIEYVNNSYNDLEKVFNIINTYIETHDSNSELLKDFNSVGIFVMKNKVVVNYVEIDEKLKNKFKEEIVDSDLIEFEQGIDNVDTNNKCKKYPDKLGDNILEEHADLLMNIRVANVDYVTVSLNVYEDNTYELFTAYKTCRPGAVCNMMLSYSKSIKGKYNYDVNKIIEESTNANDKSYSMDNLPEYEIYLGEKYIEKYDTLTFTVEKGKKNKYLDEFLKSIDVDLSMCAKGEYKK